MTSAADISFIVVQIGLWAYVYIIHTLPHSPR